MYDYFDEMRTDVFDALIDRPELLEGCTADDVVNDKWDVASRLNDELWIDDSVTGNASGSYTFSRWKAQENVIDNMSLLLETVEEFGIDSLTVSEKFLSEDWEYFDVCIRCHLLYSVISDVLDEIADEIQEIRDGRPSAEVVEIVRRLAA